ncbi:MAG: FUN14 domain-containing protein [Planctomycetota bacterium]
MTETPEPVEIAEAPRKRGFGALPRWKKILVVGAGALLVCGLAMLPFELGGSDKLSTSQSGGGAMLQPAGTGGPEVVGQDPEMSPALLKLGFSFFAAFAAGLAIRSFLRIAMIFVGLQILALMGLSYLQWVTVHWETMSSAFDVFAKNVQQEAGSFRTFITGSLPQAGLATMGLFAGLKR